MFRGNPIREYSLSRKFEGGSSEFGGGDMVAGGRKVEEGGNRGHSESHTTLLRADVTDSGGYGVIARSHPIIFDISRF